MDCDTERASRCWGGGTCNPSTWREGERKTRGSRPALAVWSKVRLDSVGPHLNKTKQKRRDKGAEESIGKRHPHSQPSKPMNAGLGYTGPVLFLQLVISGVSLRFF